MNQSRGKIEIEREREKKALSLWVRYNLLVVADVLLYLLNQSKYIYMVPSNYRELSDFAK